MRASIYLFLNITRLMIMDKIKITLLASLITLLSYSSYSTEISSNTQNSRDRYRDTPKWTFDLGLKGGWTLPAIDLNNWTDTSQYSIKNIDPTRSSGYNIGAWVRIGGRKLFIQPEAYYASNNGSISYEIGGDRVTQETKFKSFDIPILIGYKLIDLRVVQINCFTGPVISASIDQDANIGDIPVPITDIDRAEWAYQAGIGFDTPVIRFDFRYEWDITGFEIDNPLNFEGVTLENSENVLSLHIAIKIL